jgi:hypothetical protein
MRDPKMQHLAWTGIVTMHNAAWGDETGSTVTFKLPMNTSGESRNPFHTFTKRRKGKAGTRFFMAVTTAESAPVVIYRDEVMLAGWNDSQLHGHTVKFWICNDKMGHPFEGFSRTQEMALALSELDDDNEPVDQKMRDRVEQQHDTGRQKLSNVAAMLCRTEAFWAYTQDIPLAIHPGATDDESAKQWMYQELGMDSRAELDKNPQLAQQFELKIRKPYQKWYDQHHSDPF